jgi:hypothetical protein
MRNIVSVACLQQDPGVFGNWGHWVVTTLGLDLRQEDSRARTLARFRGEEEAVGNAKEALALWFDSTA